MSTEDMPAQPRAIAHTNMVTKECAGRCGATSTEPGYEDRGERRVKPVAIYPYICLSCWLDGWRSDGPIDQGNGYRIFHIDGKQLPA